MNFDPAELLAQPSISTDQIEATVLSILMGFPASFDDVSDRLRAEHFSVDAYRSIYAELSRQMADGKGYDVMTLAQALDGLVSLAEIVEVSRSHDHSRRGLDRHVQTMIDASRARQLHALSHRIAELAFETGPVQDRIDRAQAEVAKLGDVAGSDDWVDAHAAAIQHLDTLDARESGTVHGLPTGLTDLDEMLDGGLQRGNLVVIGARPAMGKTALAMSIGLHMARDHDVGMLSLEMPHADVRDRQAAILSRASIGAIKRPKKGLDYSRIVDGVERAKTLRWHVSDQSGLNILQVRAKARTLKRRKGLDVLIVDYIGLMSGLDSKQPRAYQIEEISRGLKGLAKELSIVVLCLAQVNRGGVERSGQIPALHDLRDSGAIEQDADVVAFIHRPIQANPDAGSQFDAYALLRIAKNRQGRTGDVHLCYSGEYTLFESWGGPPPKAQAMQKTRGFDDGKTGY